MCALALTPKDLEALDYSKPIKLDLELALADGTPLFITMNVFFEQYGYSNAAWSTDKARLKHLESIVRGVKAGTRASDLTGNSKP